MRHAVLSMLLLAAPGCSIVFGSSRHTSGDAGEAVDAPRPVDAPLGDAEAPDAAPCTDLDGDGFCLPDDCDDGNELIYPGANPICGNAQIESCAGASTLSLRNYFGAEEVGFSLERESVAATTNDLAFALLQGSRAAIRALVALTDGTELNSILRIQNLARFDLAGEMGLQARARSTLLGTGPFVASGLSLAPAYDSPGISLRIGLFGPGAPPITMLREVTPFDEVNVGERTLGGSGVDAGIASALVTLGLASDSATHVVYAPGSPSTYYAASADVTASSPYGAFPIPGFSAASVLLRSAVDGLVLVQDTEAPTRAAIFEVATGARTIDDPAIVGPIAPIRGGSPALLFQSSLGVQLATLDCGATRCVLNVGPVVYETTARITEIAGSPFVNEAHTDYRATVGLMAVGAMGGTDAPDRLVLTIANATGTMPTLTTELPQAVGGTVLRLAVGAETARYDFFSAGPSVVDVIGFAALVQNGAERELIVGSVRACASR